MSFDYTQEEITRLAKENNFTVAGIEKVMRLSNICLLYTSSFVPSTEELFTYS